MSEPNGKARLTVIGLLLTGAGLCLGAGSGWVAAVKTDAALRQQFETHLDESKDYGADIADLKTAVAVNNEQIHALTGLVTDLQESQRRLGDKIDLLISAQMREGRIPR